MRSLKVQASEEGRKIKKKNARYPQMKLFINSNWLLLTWRGTPRQKYTQPMHMQQKKTNIIQSHYQWPDVKFKGTSRWRGKKNHKKKRQRSPNEAFGTTATDWQQGVWAPGPARCLRKRSAPKREEGKKPKPLFFLILHRVRKGGYTSIALDFESRWLAMAASDRKM